MSISRYLQQTGLGLVAAAAIGVLVPAICNVTIALRHGHVSPWYWERSDFGIALIVATPFVVLSLLGIRAIRAWGAGIGATLLFWGIFYLPSMLDMSGGADIGLGLLLPFSPILIFTIALLGLLLGAAANDR